MSHFSDADGEKGIASAMAIFHQHTHDLSGERSLCNSAAVLRHAKDVNVRADWVRPGIALYGSSPDFPLHTAQDWHLKPVMSLNAAIIGIQHLKAGDTVGYGSTFVADHPMRIGVVACGYADGYPRSAPTGTPVCVDGHRSRTVGRVSMDLITVDITELPEANLGSEVTLWGVPQKTTASDQPRVGVAIDEVAKAAGTVGYELMCGLAPRVPVMVKN
jgi:alanine racemase